MDIICISSQVAYGPVGNSAAVPALEHAGFTVFQVPTTILSNHPGHGKPATTDVSAETLEKTLEILGKEGWLDRCGAVMTGYFRDEHQISVAARVIAQLKRHNPSLVYLCDPVMGDDHTDLYVPLPVAQAIKEKLLPLADIMTPNRFELEWITDTAITSLADAMSASRKFAIPVTLATSLPTKSGFLETAVIEPDNAGSVRTAHRVNAPHGAGDILSGLFLAAILQGGNPAAVLGRVMASLEHVLDASGDTGALALPAGLSGIDTVTPLPLAGADTCLVAGVDGCPAGWVTVTWDGEPDGIPHANIVPDFDSVLALPAVTIAVDMPIGFPERAGRGGRQACVETRARLGNRKSSVFSVPARAAVMCTDYWEACSTNQLNSEPSKKVSKQCFNLFGKMREIDALITPQLQDRVFEVHPELAFWAMNNQAPLALPKKIKSRPDPDGMALRRELLRGAGFPIDRLQRGNWKTSQAAEDDILDACAAAWSAGRIRDGEHVRLPADPPRDGRGLRMEINA